METAETKLNGPSLEKKGNGSAGDMEAADANHDLVTSESKTPLKTPSKDVEVKFVNDSINGDAKVDIDNMKGSFAGMAKEELLKYTNDPFWVRTRLLLFIFFWAVWIAMFVGAIAIIVMAPRCESPEPRKWFQTGPLFEVKSEKIEEINAKLPYFASVKAQGLIVPPVMKTDANKAAIDFKAINEELGTLEELKKFVTKAKALGIHIIMNFVPNYSSDQHVWFNKSVAKEDPYTDYYVWANSPGVGADTLPNNWQSVDGGPAWEWSAERGQFYLHQFGKDQPDLNFHNTRVMKELNDTLSFWMDQGITAFSLDKAQYLLEDPELGNETVGNKPGTFHNQYDFYGHHKTYKLPGDAEILSQWRQLVEERTQGQGMLMITGEVPVPRDRRENDTRPAVDLAVGPKGLQGEALTAPELRKALAAEGGAEQPWRGTRLTSAALGPLADRFGEDLVDGLHMVTMLLPGTPVTLHGDELGLGGPEAPDANLTEVAARQRAADGSHLANYEALVKTRGTQAVLYGTTALQAEDGLLTVTRIKSGSPGYLTVLNLSGHNVTTNLTWVDHLPEELSVLVRTPATVGYQVKEKLRREEVSLGPLGGVVFTFVPQMD